MKARSWRSAEGGGLAVRSRCSVGWAPRFGICWLLMSVATVAAEGAGAAADPPRPPGLAAEERRVAVDPNLPPWNSIARVQTNIGSRCTGVLIASDIVLTAAHCLYNRRTHRLLQAGSLHVLLGYQRSTYRWHRLVARYVSGPGFDGGLRQAQSADWARLYLAEPVAAPPLPVAPEAPEAGTEITLAGYNQDRTELLMADPSCRLTGGASLPGGTFLTHDCAATRGTSGGPLLTRRGAGWAVVGLNIGVGATANIALPASAWR